MRNVNSYDLKNIIKTNESGRCAKICSAEYNNHKYCYRVYDIVFDKWIIDNIGELTEEEFAPEYLKPLYMVDRRKGTLSEFAENVQDLNFICDINKLIGYLKVAKGLVVNLHNIHKYIHGDLSASNIIVNDDEAKIYICDFDTAIKVGKEPNNYTCFSEDIYPYLRYYKFDKNVDVYKFNLMTLAVLLNKYENEVFSLIAENQLGEYEDNKHVKTLAKELLLYDTRKAYSGEFIIDYIDDFKYRC